MKVWCMSCGAEMDTSFDPPVCRECNDLAPEMSTIAPDTVATPGSEDLPTISTVEKGDATYLKKGVLSPPTRPGLKGSFGRFEVLRMLGAGAMGNVYLAREPMTDSLVAIKVLKSELSKRAKVVKYFLAEAKHMYTMSHPNILKVLEVSESDQGPFFVMPYVKGGSLRDKMTRGVPMEKEEVLAVALPMAEGLVYAHERGIIHRDLKPDNLLVGDRGEVLISDFGLVRTVFNEEFLEPGKKNVEGTPAYMSPAVAAGQAEDTRTDIYSFGAVLYELLTGERPYSGRTAEEVLQSILDGPPISILKVEPEASKGLAMVAEGAMGRALRDRYAAMEDVVADLRRIKEGKKPVGPNSQRVRRRLPRTAVAALIAGAGVGIAISMMQPPPEVVPEATPVVRDSLLQARDLLKEGDAAAAEVLLRARVANDPVDADAWFLIGEASMAKNELLAARIAYDKVLRLSPNHRQSILRLKEAFKAEGMPRAYTNMLTWYYRLEPDDYENFSELLNHLIDVRHLPAANTTYTVWARNNPEHADHDIWKKKLADAAANPLPAKPPHQTAPPKPGQKVHPPPSQLDTPHSSPRLGEQHGTPPPQPPNGPRS